MRREETTQRPRETQGETRRADNHKSRAVLGAQLSWWNMLEHLTPREFEEYCQLLLTCQNKCKVELTKQSCDEGRDLLVHHFSGLEVVECKHWPNGTVGRPVVQKLHSAVLTANSQRGSIITTGRFSNEAEVYARSLSDVKIELIDAGKLAYLISIAFPNGTLSTKLSAASKTTPDAEFPQVFAQSIFSKIRYRSAAASKGSIRVTRVTEYETYFVGTFHAEGNVNTAVGEYSESWDGSIWILPPTVISALSFGVARTSWTQTRATRSACRGSKNGSRENLASATATSSGSRRNQGFHRPKLRKIHLVSRAKQ